MTHLYIHVSEHLKVVKPLLLNSPSFFSKAIFLFHSFSNWGWSRQTDNFAPVHCCLNSTWKRRAEMNPSCNTLPEIFILHKWRWLLMLQKAFMFFLYYFLFFFHAANNGALSFWNSSVSLKACRGLCPSALWGVQSLHVCLHFEKWFPQITFRDGFGQGALRARSLDAWTHRSPIPCAEVDLLLRMREFITDCLEYSNLMVSSSERAEWEWHLHGLQAEYCLLRDPAV